MALLSEIQTLKDNSGTDMINDIYINDFVLYRKILSPRS